MNSLKTAERKGRGSSGKTCNVVSAILILIATSKMEKRMLLAQFKKTRGNPEKKWGGGGGMSRYKGSVWS